jgi:hypothetical protein
MCMGTQVEHSQDVDLVQRVIAEAKPYFRNAEALWKMEAALLQALDFTLCRSTFVDILMGLLHRFGSVWRSPHTVKSVASVVLYALFFALQSEHCRKLKPSVQAVALLLKCGWLPAKASVDDVWRVVGVSTGDVEQVGVVIDALMSIQAMTLPGGVVTLVENWWARSQLTLGCGVTGAEGVAGAEGADASPPLPPTSGPGADTLPAGAGRGSDLLPSSSACK